MCRFPYSPHSRLCLPVHSLERACLCTLVSLPGEGLGRGAHAQEVGRAVSARLQLPFPAWRELAGVETRVSGGQRRQTGGGVPAGVSFSRTSFHLCFPKGMS